MELFYMKKKQIKGLFMSLLFCILTFILLEIQSTAQNIKKDEVKKNASICETGLHHIPLKVALYLSITNQDEECVKLILRKGLNPNYKLNDNDGAIPIIMAASVGNISILNELIKSGADVNIKGKENVTALLIACSESDFRTIKILVKSGADVNAKNSDGSTALMIASYKGQKQSVEYLLNAGADVNTEATNGMTSLMLAADNKELIKYLLAVGAKIEATDQSGWTAVLHAVQKEQVNKLELLLTNGAEVNIKAKDGITPQFLAESINDSIKRKRILTLLREFGAK